MSDKAARDVLLDYAMELGDEDAVRLLRTDALPESCRPRYGTPMDHLRLALAWRRIAFDYDRLSVDRDYYEQKQAELRRATSPA